MAKNGWKLSKVAITGSTRSFLAKNGRSRVLANQIRPTTLSAVIVVRVHPFLAKKHRELPFLAIASYILKVKHIPGWLFFMARLPETSQVELIMSTCSGSCSH